MNHLRHFSIALVLTVAGTALAQTPDTPESCEALGGSAMLIRGVETCLVPFLPKGAPDVGYGVSDCEEVRMGGGAFCEIILDTRYKEATPDCDDVADRKPVDPSHDDPWILAQETPLSDGWICARLARIAEQRRN